jgi:type IV secretion system protein VirD4
MGLQQARRTNPYPWTWELPAAAVVAVLLVMVIAVHGARSIANVTVGGGWQFTDRSALFGSLPSILGGDAGAGLTSAAASASSRYLWVWISATELATVVVTALVLRSVLRRWGPGRVLGMASPSEATVLLGEGRLRRNAAMIRPDRPLAGRLRTFEPGQVGWRLGVAAEPRTGRDLWAPWDRTVGVIGPQGSGKTLDLLVPALLGAPGAAIVTLTKVDDLLLTIDARSEGGRPCVVLDPFGLAPGLPELVWDPIDGCVDPMVAERRAKAFTAGTVKGSVAGGHGDDAARFYAAEASKVIQAFFHAAALAGQGLDEVLRWVANPRAATEPTEILREHPHAAPFWHGLLHGALRGDDRTAGNTVTTVQQAMSLFFQADIRRRCVPSPGRSGTDIADLIARGGTIYLLGREDPYASASPLMTAVAEHILDTALAAANSSEHGRLCPPMLACLDELPSTAPLPTLRTRMANERALGLSFVYAAQTWRQLAAIFGEQEARALFGLTNVLCMFGGSKDVTFNQEISDMLGPVRVSRHTWQSGTMAGRNTTAEDIPILTGAEVRQLAERHALVVAENGKPIIAKLSRAIDRTGGKRLLVAQARRRQRVEQARHGVIDPHARATAARVEAQRHGLARWSP